MGQAVVRSMDSKWYVSEENFPEPVYPTYTLGMGYIFSNDLPRKYVDISISIKFINIEDAYIGMCMKKLGIEPTSPPDPSQFRAYNVKFDRCEFSQIITYILGSAQELINYWTDLKSLSHLVRTLTTTTTEKWFDLKGLGDKSSGNCTNL